MAFQEDASFFFDPDTGIDITEATWMPRCGAQATLQGYLDDGHIADDGVFHNTPQFTCERNNSIQEDDQLLVSGTLYRIHKPEHEGITSVLTLERIE